MQTLLATAMAAQAIIFSATWPTSPSLLIPLSSSSSAGPFHFALVGQPLRPSFFAAKLAVGPKPLVVATSSKKAVAVLKGSSTVEGIVTLVQEKNGPTTVKVRVTGLAPGLHGFHLHEYGDTTNGCISTGAHFNPNKMTHGAPQDEVRHAGDLGNIVANSEGVAEAIVVDNQIPLSGPHSVVGRAFVVHELQDDLGKGGHELSLTTGNAGGRLACGVVGLTVLE